ncbi:hypothetical protein [Microbacterium sp. 2FI]|uniref:hypothetical protein n=1 Tax=Microbacterium sp. 2FI TaxID=2502193 RepID=UPI0010F852EB|nr:hypothetical protein [Microbacterium sp. 2FI]
MALAQLREVDGDGDAILLELDTGTNPFFRVSLGTEVRTVDGIAVLDAPYWSSPWQQNPRAGRHLDTSTAFPLDRAVVTERRTLVQVQSAKDRNGRARAFSRPARLEVGGDVPVLGSAPGEEPAMTLSLSRASASAPVPAAASAPLRTALAHETAAAHFSRPASLDDLLGSLVQVAGPLLQGLLSGGGAGGTAGAGGSPISTEVLGELLRTVLAAAGGAPAAAGGAPATTGGASGAAISPPPPAATHPAAPAHATAPAHAGAAAPGATAAGGAAGSGAAAGTAGPTAAGHAGADLFGSAIDPLPLGGDLFSTPESVRMDWTTTLARPMWGGGGLIRLTDTLVGVLPQLLNAIADRHSRRGDSECRSLDDALPAPARARLVQLLQSRGNAAERSDAGIDELVRLLRTGTVPAPVGTPVTPTPAGPAAAQTQSVAASGASGAASDRASRAVLTPLLAPPIARPLGPRAVFATSQAITLRFQLDVGADGPATALARAILDVEVREPGGATALLSRSERLSDVRPGTPLSVALTTQEVAALPRDVDLEVSATLRWRGKTGVYRSGCVSRIVVSATRSVSARGASAGEARELTDMGRFRSFWNRVWSTTDGAEGDLPLWGFDATLRYSVVLAGTDRGNGLMQTRADLRPGDGGVRELTGGRFKAGIEIAPVELNALLPLWEGSTPLPPEAVEAFAAPAWRAGAGGDTTVNVRFDGRRNTRGALWVVPVLDLRTFTLTTASELDAYGQVIAVAEEQVRFPVIEAVRVLGLASSVDEEAAEATPSGYRFDGYSVVFDVKAGLEPAVGGA